MDKFFSDKSKAKSRGLAKIGDKALAAADELLFKGEDGRWGYNVHDAEAVEGIKRSNGFADLLAPVVPPVGNGTVTKHSIDGKRKVIENGVEVKPAKPEQPVSEKEPRSPQPRGASHKGYKIEKERERRNGVTRPSTGTLCGQVWAEFDKRPDITSKDLPSIATEHGWNRNNVSCEFYNWRKFNGITGRSN